MLNSYGCRHRISDLPKLELHLKRVGFKKYYWVWTSNGEELTNNIPETTNVRASSSRLHMEFKEKFNLIDGMVGDAFGLNVTYDELQDFDWKELSNENVQKFYQLLKEINASLFKGLLESKL